MLCSLKSVPKGHFEQSVESPNGSIRFTLMYPAIPLA
ncbi:hypothetical protein V5785_12225 [Bacillus subtilis]